MSTCHLVAEGRDNVARVPNQGLYRNQMPIEAVDRMRLAMILFFRSISVSGTTFRLSTCLIQKYSPRYHLVPETSGCGQPWIMNSMKKSPFGFTENTIGPFPGRPTPTP